MRTPAKQVTIDLGGQELDVSALSQFSVSAGYDALTANMVAGYSSFGPTPDGQLKPDIVATGGWDPSYSFYGGFYVPTQSFDAYDSELYSANGFMAEDGTSFSSALVAGAAALAVQAHPGLRGTQVRSLIVNASAAQAVGTDDSSPAVPVDAQWIGAGLLDAGAATNATVTAEPATISFRHSAIQFAFDSEDRHRDQHRSQFGDAHSAGFLLHRERRLRLVVRSYGHGEPFQQYVSRRRNRHFDGHLCRLAARSGEYSGSVALQGSSLHIPFMLLVGSGTAYNIEPNFVWEGTVLEGPPGMDTGAWAYLQVTDAFGVPVANAPVTFSVSPSRSLTMNSVSGHPACSPASSSSSITCPTDQFGWAWMDVVLGNTAGQPQINYSAAGFQDFFYANIQAPPAILAGGVADAASYQTTLVPGSYAAIFGSNFTNANYPVSQIPFAEQCPAGPCVYPISFNYVTVSFDVPNATYPGFPYFVSPGQVNLLVPWELAGQTSAQVKVSWDFDLYSNVVTVPIVTYNPSFFQSCNAACALDLSYKLISTANPATRGNYIQLFANGLGPVTNPPGDGVAALASPLSETTTTPVVTIGGAVVPSSDVLFSGLAPGFPSLYQVNVKVPTNAQTGNVPITIQIGGVTSPASTPYGTVTIPVQ